MQLRAQARACTPARRRNASQGRRAIRNAPVPPEETKEDDLEGEEHLTEEELVDVSHELLADLHDTLTPACHLTGYPVEFFLRPEGHGPPAPAMLC